MVDISLPSVSIATFIADPNLTGPALPITTVGPYVDRPDFIVSGTPLSTVDTLSELASRGYLTAIAGEPMSAHSVIQLFNGIATYASNDSIQLGQLGLATGSVGVGDVIGIITGGFVTEPTWNFRTGSVFLGTHGALTQDRTGLEKQIVVGHATSTTSLFLQFQQDVSSSGENTGNIQVDWNSVSGQSQILNKPNLDIYKLGLSTGVLRGGILRIHDISLLHIDEGESIYVDFSNIDYPIVEILQWPETHIDPGLSSADSSRLWVGVARASANTPSFVFSTEFTALEKRNIAILGRVWGNGGSVIEGVGQYTTPAFDVYGTLLDLVDSLGSLNRSGNVFTPNGQNMYLDKSAGSSFRFSANFINSPRSPNIIQNPNLVSINAYHYHVYGNINTILLSTIDAGHYDNNGTLTEVPINTWTVQRIYYFPKSDVVDVVYGQTLYDSQELAENKLTVDDVIIDNTNLGTLKGAILRSYLIVRNDCNDLSSALASILDAKNVGGGGGGAISINGKTTINSSIILTPDDFDDSTSLHKFISEVEKDKLASIEEGAQVRVQPDWNATSGPAEILNKPVDGSIDSSTYTITKFLILKTDWEDTGIKSNDLPTGTYVIQLYANDVSSGGLNSNEYYSGIVSWYDSITNSDLEMPTDEIQLHRAGHSNEGDLYLRTYRTLASDPDNLKLQIYSTDNTNSPSNYVFTFKKII